MKIRLVRPIVCPLCGYRMGKGDMHRYGFRCPGCREWLHLDTDGTYAIVKVALWAYIVAFFVTLLAGLSWRAILAWTVGVPLTITVVGSFIGGWFRPKLARGAVPRGSASLRITPPDEPAKKE